MSFFREYENNQLNTGYYWTEWLLLQQIRIRIDRSVQAILLIVE